MRSWLWTAAAVCCCCSLWGHDGAGAAQAMRECYSLRAPTRARVQSLLYSPRPPAAILLPAAYWRAHPTLLKGVERTATQFVAILPINPLPDPARYAVDFSNPATRTAFIQRAQSTVAALHPHPHALLIDFLNHPALFPSARRKTSTSAAERAFVTKMLAAIRDGTGVPLWIHAPDSPAAARALGIELADVLPLVACYAAGGHFHLEPWSVPAALAQQYHVPFAAVLDPHGFSFPNDQSMSAPDNPLLPRGAPATYQARLAEVRHTPHVDSVIWVDPPAPIDPAPYAHKRFFVTYRNPRGLGVAFYEGYRLAHLPLLAKPVRLPATYPINVLDTATATNALLALEADVPRACALQISLNKHPVKQLLRRQAGVHVYEVNPHLLKEGENTISVTFTGTDSRQRTPLLRALAIETNYPKDETLSCF